MYDIYDWPIRVEEFDELDGSSRLAIYIYQLLSDSVVMCNFYYYRS